MPRLEKGSIQATEHMKMVRSKKKNNKAGTGLFGDILKTVGKTALQHAPIPSFAKDIGDQVIDFGVGKTGLGVKKQKKTKKGAALNLP